MKKVEKTYIISSSLIDKRNKNFQTLAGIGADIFGGDKQIGGGASPPMQPKVPTQGGMVATHDPNYQVIETS